MMTELIQLRNFRTQCSKFNKEEIHLDNRKIKRKADNSNIYKQQQELVQVEE